MAGCGLTPWRDKLNFPIKAWPLKGIQRHKELKPLNHTTGHQGHRCVKPVNSRKALIATTQQSLPMTNWTMGIMRPPHFPSLLPYDSSDAGYPESDNRSSHWGAHSERAVNNTDWGKSTTCTYNACWSNTPHTQTKHAGLKGLPLQKDGKLSGIMCTWSSCGEG